MADVEARRLHSAQGTVRGEVDGRRLAGGRGPGPRRRWQEARWRRGATAIGATATEHGAFDRAPALVVCTHEHTPALPSPPAHARTYCIVAALRSAIQPYHGVASPEHAQQSVTPEKAYFREVISLGVPK